MQQRPRSPNRASSRGDPTIALIFNPEDERLRSESPLLLAPEKDDLPDGKACARMVVICFFWGGGRGRDSNESRTEAPVIFVHAHT